MNGVLKYADVNYGWLAVLAKSLAQGVVIDPRRACCKVYQDARGSLAGRAGLEQRLLLTHTATTTTITVQSVVNTIVTANVDGIVNLTN